MTLTEATKLAKATDYAHEATHTDINPINWADAAAFYLEGWRQGMAEAAAITVGCKDARHARDLICNHRDHIDA